MRLLIKQIETRVVTTRRYLCVLTHVDRWIVVVLGSRVGVLGVGLWLLVRDFRLVFSMREGATSVSVLAERGSLIWQIQLSRRVLVSLLITLSRTVVAKICYWRLLLAREMVLIIWILVKLGMGTV